MRAIVTVSLKRDVLDPQGQAIRNAAVALGYASVSEVRQDKRFEITLEDATDRESAMALVAELAAKLLANPVIEDFHIESIEP